MCVHEDDVLFSGVSLLRGMRHQVRRDQMAKAEGRLPIFTINSIPTHWVKTSHYGHQCVLQGYKCIETTTFLADAVVSVEEEWAGAGSGLRPVDWMCSRWPIPPPRVLVTVIDQAALSDSLTNSVQGMGRISGAIIATQVQAITMKYSARGGKSSASQGRMCRWRRRLGVIGTEIVQIQAEMDQEMHLEIKIWLQSPKSDPIDELGWIDPRKQKIRKSRSVNQNVTRRIPDLERAKCYSEDCLSINSDNVQKNTYHATSMSETFPLLNCMHSVKYINTE